ncbi:MAG TPA: AmmeMemoRadiSam system protein B [Bacteroidota bacterium]|nr:AmmeMemoRadiSam system protein B [Bacteroidota bacterium]
MSASGAMTNAIRRAAVAGMFYQDTKSELAAEVDALLERASTESEASARTASAIDTTQTLCGLIVPHAGYMYSGETAARAYRLIGEHIFDTCVVVAPSHHDYFTGVSVYPGAAYETPLGICPIDAELRSALVEELPQLSVSVEGHRKEHAIEVQLPFLQRMLPEAMILPLVMGEQDAALCAELGVALARVSKQKRVLCVASSDLSHFYTSEIARVMDAHAASLIEAFNIRGFLDELESESIEACGGGPIAAVMTSARQSGAERVEIVHLCNSGDITGDTSRVVGYCSAALWGRQ